MANRPFNRNPQAFQGVMRTMGSHTSAASNELHEHLLAAIPLDERAERYQAAGCLIYWTYDENMKPIGFEAWRPGRLIASVGEA